MDKTGDLGSNIQWRHMAVLTVMEVVFRMKTERACYQHRQHRRWALRLSGKCATEFEWEGGSIERSEVHCCSPKCNILSGSKWQFLIGIVLKGFPILVLLHLLAFFCFSFVLLAWHYLASHMWILTHSVIYYFIPFS